MPGTINRLALGLNKLLEQTAFGDYPSNLGDTVVPVIDMDQFYKAQVLATADDVNPAIINIGNIENEIEIPNGEVWEPINVAITLLNNNAPNASLRGVLIARIVTPNGEKISHLTYTDMPKFFTNASNVAYGGNFQFPAKQFFAAGTKFQFQCTDLDLAGGVSVLSQLDVLHRKYTFN